VTGLEHRSQQHPIDSFFSYTLLEAVQSCRHLRRFSRLFDVTFDPPPLSFHFAGISCPLKPSQVTKNQHVLGKQKQSDKSTTTIAIKNRTAAIDSGHRVDPGPSVPAPARPQEKGAHEDPRN
jgi:hypothetical protein